MKLAFLYNPLYSEKSSINRYGHAVQRCVAFSSMVVNGAEDGLATVSPRFRLCSTTIGTCSRSPQTQTNLSIRPPAWLRAWLRAWLPARFCARLRAGLRARLCARLCAWLWVTGIRQRCEGEMKCACGWRRAQMSGAKWKLEETQW